MIYLLSEMILALAVAAVLGAAVGWIIHRSSHGRRVHELRQGVARRNSLLNQAQSDIAMLTEDYDDLHRKTQGQIDVLREENKQVPLLSDNLEKSQLLVRQMMQRHEAQLREVNNENQRLSAQLKQNDEHLDAKHQLATNLEERKREVDKDVPLSPGIQVEEKEPVKYDPESAVPVLDMDRFVAATTDVQDTEATVEMRSRPARAVKDANVQTTNIMENSAVNDSELDLPLPFENTENNAELELTTLRDDEVTQIIDRPGVAQPSKSTDTDSETFRVMDLPAFTTAESEDDPFDKVIEVADGMQFELDQTADATVDDTADSTTDHDSTMMFDSELPLDGSTDSSQLFEPVDQHDDLQQIFGIGPLTEKALNELGITSYSQLAELEQHDVQRIADALEIGHSRIEHDNWVGNARRQLEDVLEQL